MSSVHENEGKYESPTHRSYDWLYRLCKGKKYKN